MSSAFEVEKIYSLLFLLNSIISLEAAGGKGWTCGK